MRREEGRAAVREIYATVLESGMTSDVMGRELLRAFVRTQIHDLRVRIARVRDRTTGASGGARE